MNARFNIKIIDSSFIYAKTTRSGQMLFDGIMIFGLSGSELNRPSIHAASASQSVDVAAVKIFTPLQR